MKLCLVFCIAALTLMDVPDSVAQDSREPIPRTYYSGTMQGEGTVFLMITESLPGQLFGYVVSDSSDGETDLRGRLGAEHTFELRTSVEGELQERLSGFFSPGYDEISGTFSDTTRTFRLDRIAYVQKDSESMPYGNGDFVCIRTVEYPVFDRESESVTFDGYATIAKYVNAAVAEVTSASDGFCGLYLSGEPDLLSTDVETVLPFGDITLFSTNIISLLFYQETYEGGAHWNIQAVTVNLRFSPEPDVLTLKDCFKPKVDYLGKLSDVCLEQLGGQGASDVVSGAITDLREKLNTFVITPVGFLFVFDPYVVGPYAEGQFFVTVPFEVVRDMIDQAGPLGRVAGPP